MACLIGNGADRGWETSLPDTLLLELEPTVAPFKLQDEKEYQSINIHFISLCVLRAWDHNIPSQKCQTSVPSCHPDIRPFFPLGNLS